MMQLLSVKSMSRNLPAKGTADLARSLVKGCSLSPAPPAIIITRTFSTPITPSGSLTRILTNYHPLLLNLIKLIRKSKALILAVAVESLETTGVTCKECTDLCELWQELSPDVLVATSHTLMGSPQKTVMIRWLAKHNTN